MLPQGVLDEICWAMEENPGMKGQGIWFDGQGATDDVYKDPNKVVTAKALKELVNQFESQHKNSSN
jgi:hypothetical protein